MAPFLAEEIVSIPALDIQLWYFDNPRFDQERHIYVDADDTSRFWTANQCRKAIRQLAAGLQGIGLRPGDTVDIHGLNSVDYPVLANGIVTTGCAFTGSNLGYTLHAEHLLEIRKLPVPTRAKLVSYCKLIDILDKGKASIAIVGTLSKDADSDEEVFYNESLLFLRGAGGFGGSSTRTSSSGSTGTSAATMLVPSGTPTRTFEEQTKADQAVLYRLNGDRNPLHVSPSVAKAAGFEEPILHGLCTFGIVTKHIVATFGQIQNAQIKFISPVTPGQTLVSDVWRNGSEVRLRTRVKETEKVCLSGIAKLKRGRDGQL